MAVSLIEGVVEAAELRRSKGKYALYDNIRFRQRDGTERTLTKVCASGDVAKALKPGASGRFYVSRGLDQTGIHGVRLDDGTSAYGHFNNMELILLIGVGAGVLMLLVGLTGQTAFMITPVVLLPLMLLGFFLFRKVRLEGRRQFDGDTAEPAPAPATP